MPKPATTDGQEELRLLRRESVLRSTYDFARVVCGFRDLDPRLHGFMCRWIQNGKKGLAPRGHLKTSCWTIAENLRFVTEDPNRRVLLVNEVVGNSAKWIRFMQSICQGEVYRWLFPDRIPNVADRSVRWNETQLELRRSQSFPEPTIEGIGCGGASTSNHYDRVHEDDLVGKAARESEKEMKTAIAQHLLAESLLVAPDRAIFSVCTRWHPHDVADWQLRNERDLDYLCLKALVRGKDRIQRPLWPARFPLEKLEDIRRKFGPAWWSLQYMNEAIAEGVTAFDPAHLRRYRWLRVPTRSGNGLEEALELHIERRRRVVRLSDCTKFQTIDAGLSPESTSARTASVVVGLTPPVVQRGDGGRAVQRRPPRSPRQGL
jgi:hypothetical protein